MSINLFFRAFPQNEISAMEKNHALINQWVGEGRYVIGTDVETAWDVLTATLDGLGIAVGTRINDALFNGCSLISADTVKDQAQKLSEWTRERVLERFLCLDDADLYRLDLFQEDEEYLLEQFDRMLAFYMGAAARGLGALSYSA